MNYWQKKLNGANRCKKDEEKMTSNNKNPMNSFMANFKSITLEAQERKKRMQQLQENSERIISGLKERVEKSPIKKAIEDLYQYDIKWKQCEACEQMLEAFSKEGGIFYYTAKLEEFCANALPKLNYSQSVRDQGFSNYVLPMKAAIQSFLDFEKAADANVRDYGDYLSIEDRVKKDIAPAPRSRSSDNEDALESAQERNTSLAELQNRYEEAIRILEGTAAGLQKKIDASEAKNFSRYRSLASRMLGSIDVCIVLIEPEDRNTDFLADVLRTLTRCLLQAQEEFLSRT